jgi:hypothetical protein
MMKSFFINTLLGFIMGLGGAYIAIATYPAHAQHEGGAAPLRIFVNGEELIPENNEIHLVFHDTARLGIYTIVNKNQVWQDTFALSK